MEQQNQFQSNKSILNFGSTIYLSYENEQNEIFISQAEGFTKNRVQLLQESHIKKYGNYMSGLFKVYPSFYNSQYLKIKTKYEQKQIDQQQDSVQFNKRTLRQEIPKQVKQMDEEAQLNYEQYKKLKGTPVLYGQIVQFLHYNSNKYLYLDQNHVSDYEYDNLKVQLKEEYSDQTCFRILPCFSYQQENQGIIYNNDFIYIKSTLECRNNSGELYLHASADALDLNQKKQKLLKKISKSNTSNNESEKNYKKKEINASSEQKSQWKIRIFSEYVDDKLSVCDIIWINYSEQDVYIIYEFLLLYIFYQKKKKKKKLNLITQKYDESNEKYLLKFEGFEQTEKYQKFIGNSNGMFIIQSQNMHKGGLVEWNKDYKLRHLTTGFYLSLGNVVRGINEIDFGEQNKLLVLVKNIKQASSFKFELVQSSLIQRNKEHLTKYLQKDSYFRMSCFNKNQTYWLKTADSKEFGDIMSCQLEVQIYPAFSTTKKEEYVFKLAKANQNEVRMTQFLLSCRKVITKAFKYLNPEYIEEIKSMNYQEEYNQFIIKINRLEKCLIDLNLFCCNKLLAYLYIDQQYGQINNFIQNVLKEQHFVELLVSLLALSFPKIQNLQEALIIENEYQNKFKFNNIYNNNNNQQNSIILILIFFIIFFIIFLDINEYSKYIQEQIIRKKIKFCVLIYKLLSNICTNNQKNQEKASLYLPLFAVQFRYIPSAMDCILQIINNYQELLFQLYRLNNDFVKGEIKYEKLQQKEKLSKEFQQQYQKRKSSGKENNYNEKYEKMTFLLKERNQIFNKEQWDMIQYFCFLLVKSKDFGLKKQILRFLSQGSCFFGEGVNVNQELIYEYLIKNGLNRIYQENHLVQIKSQGKDLIIYLNNDQISNNLEVNIEKLVTFLGKNINKKQKNENDMFVFISCQIEFLATMCNSRNYTWKNFIEQNYTFNALAETITEEQYSYDFRAQIYQLLNKLYIVQEPQKIQNIPELCMVLKFEQKGQKKQEVEEEENYQADENIEKIKDKLLIYIGEKAREIQEIFHENPNQINDEIKKREIQQKAGNIYNNLTYEILKIVYLLIQFGCYDIKREIQSLSFKQNKQEQVQESQIFKILQYAMTIFEYDKTFPEARKVLVQKRKEKQEQIQNKLQEQGKKIFYGVTGIMGKAFNMINFFEVLQQENNEKNKKKKKENNIEIIAEDQGIIGGGFLKQNDVLKKILQKILNENQDEYEFKIKCQICNIFGKYLDYKHDYMLSRIKNQFVYIVQDKFNLIQKIQSFENDFKSKSEVIREFKKFVQDNIQCFFNQVLCTGTCVDEMGEFQKQFQSFFFDKRKDKFSKDGELININQILNSEIFPSLVMLFCFSQDYEMEKKILGVLCKFYNQRNQLADLLSQLILLFDEGNQKIHEITKFKLKKLTKFIEESESWMSSLNNEGNLEILEKTRNDFDFFGKILIKNSQVRVIQNNQKSEDQYEVFIENENEIDFIRQKILYHNKVYELAINLIKDSVHILQGEEEKRKKNNQNIQTNIYCSKMRELFKSCFFFLKNFVKYNTFNQEILSENLVSLLQALPFNVGLSELYCEIFQNNKHICLSKQTEITDDFIKLIISNGRQAKYLDFFLIIQKTNNEYLIKNQKLVLNLFLDPKYKHILLYLDNDKNQNKTKGYTFSFQKQYEEDEPYVYHAKLLDVLAFTTIGKEGMYMSEQKLRQNINLKYVFELLSQKDELCEGIMEQIGLLKIPLLKYIYYTFLESEKISDEFVKYIEDFIRFIQKENQRILSQEKFSKFFYVYFDIFLFVLHSYKAIFSQDKEFSNKLQNQINSEIHILIENIIKKKLVFVNEKYYFDQNEINYREFEIYRNRWRKFIALIGGFKVNNIIINENSGFLQIDYNNNNNNNNNNNYNNNNNNNKLYKKMAMVDSPQNANNIYKNNTDRKTNNNIFFQLGNFIKKEQIEIDPDVYLFNQCINQNEIWQILWNIFLQTFLNSEKLVDLIKVEQKIFALALDKVEYIFQKIPIINEIINKGEIFRKLINFLEKAHNDNTCTSTFKLVLNVLGNFIEIDDYKLQNEQYEQDQDIIESLKKENIEKNQNFLNQYGATQMIFNQLSDYSNMEWSEELFIYIIQFGVKLLYDGNKEVQKSIFNYFMNFTQSEVFFKTIHKYINDEIQKIKREKTNTNNSQEITIFNFQKKDDVILTILRFLQLLAEGHYLDLQKYMRLQTQNYHNYDLLEAIIGLLNAYFFKKQEKYIKNMTQCFDTLTEYIQGPCKENQMALIQDNFLDLASSLLSIDEVMEDQEAEKALPKWEIAKLKYKCSITLISLLEGRKKEDDIVVKMIKSINYEIIKRNIVDIYHLYKIIGKQNYNKELFNHFDDEQNEENQQGFIIETGFNLYIILSIFNEEEENYQQENKLKKRKKKREKTTNILKNNLVLDIFGLAFTMAKGIKDMVQEQANKVHFLVKNKDIGDDIQTIKIKQKALRELLMQEAVQFFQQNTLHIEVLREGDNYLEKTYFYCPYFCKDLDKQTKKKFNMNANRISVKSKVTSLMQESQNLIKVMRHNYNLNSQLKKIRILHILSQQINLLRDIAFVLAIAINLMVLFSFQRDENKQIVNLYTQKYITTIGIILIVLTLIIVLYFLLLTAPILIMKAWEGVVYIIYIQYIIYFFFKKKDKINLLKYIIRFIKTIYLLLSDFYVLYYIIYGITAIVGLSYTPFFFVFHLFDILVRFPELLNVVRSVYIPRKPIMYTYFLFLVLLYVFSLFGYYWLRESFPPTFCESVFTCLLTTFDKCFKYDGGLGGYLNNLDQIEDEKNSTTYFLIRFFYDNIFFIICMIIMINIVSGIIIDQFGELRDKLKEYEQDLNNKCFICNFSSEEIEKESDQNQDFITHIRQDHCMWNYLYYIAYLQDKKQTEYTGIESYVAEKIEKEEIGWFPINRALCMNKRMQAKENQEVIISLKEMNKSQLIIKDTLNILNQTVDKISQKENNYVNNDYITSLYQKYKNKKVNFVYSLNNLSDKSN
ncbi:MIR domain protein [Ichthyophthirius multifiliis]|uniref:MIR domain protein n=1 Tax=Ichthyophthirius multifiliis TaxID=5932 RepID=G0QWJ8_ICHMU|nr:MIR domain protein [Ichthyophthirius multifiliis]EGR30411.1 MIR domain protein [Ichthyophthirius multifiliis]|eukprot:XP_004031998.1 MIR domain protein [Ichthyophthirius multifiliis]